MIQLKGRGDEAKPLVGCHNEKVSDSIDLSNDFDIGSVFYNYQSQFYGSDFEHVYNWWSVHR